ncbi:MAG: VOC family protein [Bacteriovoracaceae bacterium]
MKELIGDHNLFLNKLMKHLDQAQIEVKDFMIDHLCYRVQSLSEYEEMKEKLSQYGKLLTEEEVGGRPIASFKLFNPLSYFEKKIPLIELPAPKKNSVHKSGLEHAEMVIPHTFEQMMAIYPHVSFVTKGLEKKFNPELEIEFSDMAVKFHHLPLESVIAIEQEKIPPEFCNLKMEIPHLIYRADYYGPENFIGMPVEGYYNPYPLLTRVAAKMLKAAALELEQHKLGFMLFDSYRPQMAVDHFYRWSQEPGPDHHPLYFPEIKKRDLFEEGYLAKKSSHSRGSTVDLTLYDLVTKKELDMGSIFDYFHDTSHTECPKLSDEIKERRKFFVDIMKKHSFKNYRQEWWHFTMMSEPYPSIYFNFPIRDFWNS